VLINVAQSAVIRKHDLLLDLIAGRPVSAPAVVPLDPPASPVGGTHHAGHASGHSHSSGLEGAAEAAAPPLPPGVTWTVTQNGGCDVHGPQFHMLTADLRDVAAVQATLSAAGIDFSVPTLFLSE
jgi:hypothetical protein